ncbi:hypothetical protein D3C81_1744880 [compost metagenome]
MSEVVVTLVKAQPEHLPTRRDAMFAVLPQQGGFTEAGGGTDQHQSGRTAALQLRDKPGTRQLTGRKPGVGFLLHLRFKTAQRIIQNALL